MTTRNRQGGSSFLALQELFGNKEFEKIVAKACRYQNLHLRKDVYEILELIKKINQLFEDVVSEESKQHRGYVG